MTLRSLWLDAGGTLLEERLPRAVIYAQEARRRGLSVDSDRMRRVMHRVHEALSRTPTGPFRYTGAWFEGFIERIFLGELGLEPEGLPGLRQALLARFADPATFRLRPGALELLETARAAGLCLGVVSNWSEALPGLLEGLGVNARLDFALVSAVERAEKPGPELFRRALARSGVRPEEALHVGNDPVQDGGAAALGVEVWILDPDGHHAKSTDLLRLPDLHAVRALLLERLP